MSRSKQLNLSTSKGSIMTHFADRVIDLNNKEYFEIFEGLWRGEKPPLIQVGVIRNTNFTPTGEIDYSDIAYLNVEDNKFRERRLIKGDIIIERSGGGPKQPVGRVVQFNKTEGNYSFSNFTSMVRIQKPHLLFPQFAFYILLEVYQSGKTKNIERRTTGIRNLDFSLYKKLARFPLISIIEQQYICNVLSTWDRAIKRVQRLIEAKQRQKKGLMQGLLSGRLRFSEFGLPLLQNEELPEGWHLMKIGKLVKRVKKPVKINPEQKYQEIGIRSHGKGIFHKEECLGREIGTKTIFWVKPNTFVLNIVFAWEQAISRTTIQEEGMVASHRFPMYQPVDELLDLDFFVNYFLTSRGKLLLGLVSPGGAGRNKTLSQNAFLKLVIPVPPINEQKRISSIIYAIDREIEIYIRYKNILMTQKQALMQKLLTGKIRVKVD
jgi:type I restriction enzyme S subunit